MQSRSINSSRNVLSGLLKVAIKILLPFIIRSIMLYYLGKEYLGLNSLFSSVLNVLNMVELGFSSAVTYRLYKPLAENNEKKVGAYLNYLRRVYRIIGIIIFICGMVIIPLLNFIAKGGYPKDINIYILYGVYLLNTGVSYFLGGYKRAIIIASQRMDYINNIEALLFCFQYIIQIVALVMFKSYYFYIIVLPITTVLVNLLISYICHKEYGAFFSDALLSESEKKEMYLDVKGVAIYKISETTRNSFDSIVISAVLGLTAVGIYNNYYYIFNAVYSVMIILNQSLQPSVGNSIASENHTKNRNDFYKLSLFSLWLVIFSTCCLLCLYQPFIKLWVGEDMLLTAKDTALFCVYFHILNMNNIRNLYFDGNGLWLKGSYSFIIESIGNLLLNFILGGLFGITGVLIATVITMFFCSFIWRSIILFKEYFGIGYFSTYIKFHLKMIFLNICSCAICFLLGENIDNSGIMGLLLKLIICLVVPNFILYLVFRHNKLFIEGKKQAISVINSFISKGN